ncbi:hypothetical protein [Glaciibacter psychrotolerans]|uniref:Uncharacterized protein n=1 Tax=Glaciibacter psychrotolerans TaxID=670054 RepID=A0A7Z0EBD3_9MICO|nr:hypothetical protein [Leifsonia psychrotolerans]NYJ18521.1 hypothetical protein [Leifsonia psychrotolerans]
MRFVRRRRLIIAIACVLVALTVLMAFGVYGLLRGPANASEPVSTPHSASASPTLPTRIGRPQPIAATTDPEQFAHDVAHALLTWDTRYPGGLAVWVQVLVDVANADEAPAVASDARSYFPAPAIWQQLSAYGTRQSIEIKSVIVPRAWSIALDQAAPGQIPEGATAFTVVGARHRSGIWDTEEMHTARPVTFTVFVVCPGHNPCELLRLSILNQPLA